jgi:hypothetical protein
MDEWGWEQLRPWLTARTELPVSPQFRTIDGPTRGRPWSGAAVRTELRRLAASAGVRRRFTPHQMQGIDPDEIIATVHMRRTPMMSASAGLRL